MTTKKTLWLKIVFSVVALMLALASVSGCGSPPPDISVEDVVTFVVCETGAANASKPAAPTKPLDRLVAAYNQADSASWEGYTTPPLFAGLELVDGTQIVIWFAREYPERCADVGVTDARTGEYMRYRVKSPDLLPAVLELAGDSIDREALNEESGFPWLPE